jgi:hypothetical protein
MTLPSGSQEELNEMERMKENGKGQQIRNGCSTCCASHKYCTPVLVANPDALNLMYPGEEHSLSRATAPTLNAQERILCTLADVLV